MSTENKDPFLQAAIDEARKGLAEGGIPIGSVLVHDGKILGRLLQSEVPERERRDDLLGRFSAAWGARRSTRRVPRTRFA